MKYFLISVLILLFAFPVLADNTYYGQFDEASTEYVLITDASQTGLDLTSDFTIEYWIRYQTIPTTGVRAVNVQKHKVTGGHRSYSVNYLNTAGTLYFEGWISDDGTVLSYDTTAYTLTVDTWYHLAWVYDASEGTIDTYVDGVDQGTISGLDLSIYNGSADFIIACRDDSGSYNACSDAWFDDVRVWTDIRTPTEITDYDDCQLVGDEDNLVAYYQMNNDWTDETANSNDLTAFNTPTFGSATLPFTAECAGGGGATTSSSTIEVSSMPIENDIGVITSYTEIYTDSTTTPSEIRKTYYHIPFFVWLAFALVTFFIMNRVIIELLIRFRK